MTWIISDNVSVELFWFVSGSGVKITTIDLIEDQADIQDGFSLPQTGIAVASISPASITNSYQGAEDLFKWQRIV